MQTPHIVLISGSLRAGSTSDRIADWCARECREQGATARTFTGGEIDFPFYRPGISGDHAGITEFLDELGRADGVILVSPTYHGTLSGLLKNALDFVNDLAGPRPFLDGRAIGCVAVGAGTQGAVTTLETLRTIGHSLRAWPTPLGVVLPNAGSLSAEGTPGEPHHREKMIEMISQVLTVSGARARDHHERVPATV